MLKADPKIVKAAMEREKREREEERKAGAKVRGRKAKTALVFLPFLIIATARAADKHPELKARDHYAQQFAAEIEHDGWSVTTLLCDPDALSCASIMGSMTVCVPL